MFSYRSAIEQSIISGSNELMVPGRVTTCCAIPQGVTSEIIEPRALLGQVDVSQVSVKMSLKGIIELNEKSKETWPKEIHWIRAVRLSDDCHSYNLQLRLEPSLLYGAIDSKRQHESKLVLQTVKPIEAGEELLMWFSEEILAMLQVAFLTPANIQGQKKYVCTKCSVLYESPNPLKLHITLECGRYTITTFWEQLANYMKNCNNGVEQKANFAFKLIPDTQSLRQRAAIDLTTAASNTKSENLYRPYSQPSAFKPFRKSQCNTATSSLCHTLNLFPLATQIKSDNSLEDQAQIETLVSSLGKSKQGHVCLYCGKCYSRKYGLKIHIRTHTGYKPLKCKFCMRPFGDPSNLNKHVRLHAEGDTPYKCELCGKVLVRRRDLERHLKSRHMSEMYPGGSILEDSSESVNMSEEEDEEKHTVSEN